jgi:peptide/nickel transport system ATP-binding protein
VSALLSLRGLCQTYVSTPDLAERIANLAGAGYRETRVRAVDDVSFDVAEGEVVGLVGESGCGKSTLGRMVAGVEPPSAGTLAWRGVALDDMTADERQGWRIGAQMIFQDPFALAQSADAGREDRRRGAGGSRADPAPRPPRLCRRPAGEGGARGRRSDPLSAQFSGGQRQRIGIARALER